MKRAAVLAFAILSGCSLYSHNSGDDTICNGGGGVTAGAPATYDVRDPNTGICNYYSDGGGECDDSCGCAEPVAGIAQPYGSTCDGSCEALDEGTCMATAGCHADFEEAPDILQGGLGGGGIITFDNEGNPTAFVGCWDITPLAPIEGGDCTQLDAYTCAQHDDCVSIMDGATDDTTGAQYGTFSECAPENGTPPPDVCAGVDCGSGAACETQCAPCDPTTGSGGCSSMCAAMCVPDQTCDGVDCGPGYTCAESCEANAGSSSGVCFPACYPSGPTDPGSCTGTVTCTEPSPLCPTSTTAGIENGCYTGFCIPNAECGPADPGSCDPSGVHCNIAAPKCPMGTVPGVDNGCWSGFCIPEASCPIAACEALTTEAACDARSDCESVFNGSSCVCTPDGMCTCGSETWARCQTIEILPPPVPQPGPVMPAFTRH